MKVALLQLNPTIGALEQNYKAIETALETAYRQQAHIAVLPELCVSGYPPKDLLFEPAFVEDCLAINDRIAALSTSTMMVVWGNIAPNTTGIGPPLHNAAYAAVDGVMDFRFVKHHLPTYDVFYEARYFEPQRTEDIKNLYLNYMGKRIVVTLCEDLWCHPALGHQNEARIETTHPMIHPFDYPTNPIRLLNEYPFEMIINLSASPYEIDKPRLRLDLLDKIATHHGCPVIYVNQVGAQDDILYDGHSCVCWPDGISWVADGFKPATVILDLSEPNSQLPDTCDDAWQEPVYTGLAMGIRDYVHKTGFERVLIGLSGGIDSALTASLAVEALGAEFVTGVAMPGPYSSPESLIDAQALAKNLGISLLEYSINGPFETMLETLHQSPQPEQLAQQNLQARLRGQLLMTLANQTDSLVLATGNKSELATGYSTMYGDSCGALAPIGDLFKTQVVSLCEWINRSRYPAPIPEAILYKPPSAELAPDQLDTDTLPPYETLDELLQALMIDHQSLEDVLSLGYDRATVKWVFQQLQRQEYKRQQYPLILKVSAKAFGSGRLVPVVQRYGL